MLIVRLTQLESTTLAKKDGDIPAVSMGFGMQPAGQGDHGHPSIHRFLVQEMSPGRVTVPTQVKYYLHVLIVIGAAFGILWLVWRIARATVRRTQHQTGLFVRAAEHRHDTFLQGLQGLLLRFRTATNQVEAGPARELLESTLVESQNVMADGRKLSSILRSEDGSEPQDLRSAVLGLGSYFHLEEGQLLQVTVRGTPRLLWPQAWTETLAICTECFSNVARHAPGSPVSVTVTFGEPGFELTVSDLGMGLPMNVLSGGRTSGQWGIIGMKERAKNMGGSLHLSHNQPHGTIIRLMIPARSAYRMKTATRFFGFGRQN